MKKLNLSCGLIIRMEKNVYTSGQTHEEQQNQNKDVQGAVGDAFFF